MITIDKHEVDDTTYGTFIKVAVTADSMEELESPEVFSKIDKYLKSHNIYQCGYTGVRDFVMETKDGKLLNRGDNVSQEDIVFKAYYKYMTR